MSVLFCIKIIVCYLKMAHLDFTSRVLNGKIPCAFTNLTGFSIYRHMCWCAILQTTEHTYLYNIDTSILLYQILITLSMFVTVRLSPPTLDWPRGHWYHLQGREIPERPRLRVQNVPIDGTFSRLG